MEGQQVRVLSIPPVTKRRAALKWHNELHKKNETSSEKVSLHCLVGNNVSKTTSGNRTSAKKQFQNKL
jgi:hypothetical protein